MAAIVNNAFGGERPIVQPRLLNDQEAQLAQNVRLVSGRIEPLKGPSEQLTLSSAVRTIFKFKSGAATDIANWLAWVDDVHVVRSPIANDQWDRVYWTGDGWSSATPEVHRYPRYAKATDAKNAIAYRLGIPKPSGIPTAVGSPVVNATTESRSYVFTYVNAATSPTLESLPSAEYTITAADGYAVNFSNLPTSNEGDTRVTHKRIYRKVSGTYRLVTTLALADATYADKYKNTDISSAATLNSTLANAIAKPSTAPSATVSTTATTQTAYTRKYVVTFYSGVYSYTQNNGDAGQETVNVRVTESNPSSAATVSNVYDGQTVTIGNLVPPSGVSLTGGGFKIYRQIDGIGQSSYRLVGSVVYGTGTSFVDSTAHGKEGPTTFTPSADGTNVSASTPTATAGSYTPSSTQQRVYCMTFANASGNESPPSPTSNVVTVTDGQNVTLNVTATASSGVTVKRLYRKQQSEATSAWRRVAEFPVSQTSYPDTSTSASISGNSGLPSAFLDLLPTPAKVATVGSEIPAKKVPESRTYVYTYVSEYGEEGPPCSASTVIDIDPDKPVAVSGMSAAPSGPYNITLKRIYRSSTVGNQAQFQLVPVTWAGNTTPSYDVPVAITAVTDSASQSDLSETLPSETWEAPPAKLFNLRVLANGIACGFVKDDTSRTVLFSEPFLPHAWPPEYSFATEDQIVGIGVFRQSVAVLTTAYPYIISGVDPAAMTMTKLELKQGCTSSKSIVETGDGVIYASPDGLFMVGTGGIQNLTTNLFTRDQWQEFNPSSMQCFFHDGRIHIAYKTAASVEGVLILDLSGQGATLTRYTKQSLSLKCGYVDAETDAFYFMDGGKIWKFNSGSDLEYTWRSKLFRTPYPLNFSCGQVLAESYPLTIKVYADGNLKMTKIVSNANIFTLPAGFRAFDWYYEITNATTVNGVTTVNPGNVFSVSLAQSHAEIKAT